MKKNKPNEQSRVTELGEHVLKVQNTMLGTQVDQLKRQLQSLKSLPEHQDNEMHELDYYKKLSNQLSRRIRILMAYNEESIQRKVAESEEETFECLCGANQIESVKYHLINGHPKEQVQIEEVKKPPPDDSEQVKQLILEYSEQKALMQHQIEDLKISGKLPEEQFFQTSLFADLVQQNNYLTATLFNIEDQLIQEQLEKYQSQIQQFQMECETKIQEASHEQPKFEIKQCEQQDNTLIEQLKSQIESLGKVIEDLKVELQSCRERNKDAQNSLIEMINQKQALLVQNNELKQSLSVSRVLLKEEKIEQVTLRYEKHKQLLYEIEQEFVNQKPNEFIQRFREFVGYVKMRDEKVKGLEQLLDTKTADHNAIKKQIQQLFDELDYNSNAYNSINETNKNLSKLLNETQNNLSRAMTEKVDERIKFETEKHQFQLKHAQAEETIKQLQAQNEQFRKLSELIQGERKSHHEIIRQLEKSHNENKQRLLQKEQDLYKITEMSKIFQEREKLSDSINLKYLKKAEKSKSKLKHLKLQMKIEQKDTDNELWTSMKMMVDCQQCKKRVKQVILIKCLHMFCMPCIEDNQKNRNRACPVCRTKYGIEEVKSIKLN